MNTASSAGKVAEKIAVIDKVKTCTQTFYLRGISKTIVIRLKLRVEEWAIIFTATKCLLVITKSPESDFHRILSLQYSSYNGGDRTF